MNLIFLLYWMYSFEQLVILGEVVKLNYCIVLQEGKILVYGMYFTTNQYIHKSKKYNLN